MIVDRSQTNDFRSTAEDPLAVGPKESAHSIHLSASSATDTPKYLKRTIRCDIFGARCFTSEHFYLYTSVLEGRARTEPPNMYLVCCLKHTTGQYTFGCCQLEPFRDLLPTQIIHPHATRARTFIHTIYSITKGTALENK